MKRLMIGLMLVLLTGCSSSSLSHQQANGVHRVAVISAVGNVLNIRSFMNAGTGPDGLIDRGPITDMALDAYVVDQVTAKLKSHYEIVPVAYQPGIFIQTDKERSLHANAVQGRPLGQVIRATSQLPNGMMAGTETGVDLYLVVLPGDAKLQNGDRTVSGTSLSELPADDVGHSYNLGVVYWIAAIDGHTLQPVGFASTLSDHRVDTSLWASRVAALTADQKQQLAKIWQRRIDLTLAPALKELNLSAE
jgi:hypothetical protein